MTDINESVGILERLDLLEAERQIRRTLYDYAHTIDYGRELEWVDGFVDDGFYEFQYASDPAILQQSMPHGEASELGVRFVGRGQLERFAANHTRPPEMLHKHGLMEPLIDVDLATRQAEAVSYFFRLDADGNGIFISSFGRYFDSFRKCADGRWRFTRRIAKIEVMSLG